MGPTVPYGLYMYLVPSCYLHNTTSRSSLSVIHVYDAHVIYIGLILSMTKDMDHHMFFYHLLNISLSEKDVTNVFIFIL